MRPSVLVLGALLSSACSRSPESAPDGSAAAALATGATRSSSAAESESALAATNAANDCLPPELRKCKGYVALCSSGLRCWPAGAPITPDCIEGPTRRKCADGGSACCSMANAGVDPCCRTSPF